jgi:two-component system KDP operon response regulator KdpE
MTTARPRILVVDDEAPIRRALRLVLGANGFLVKEVANGQQALDTLVQEAFDLLILDLLLPDIAGVDVCARLRTWSRMPVIVLSALGEESIKVEALHAGADDYITKPFSTPELLARMQSTLRRDSWGAEPFPVLRAGQGNLTIDLRRRTVERAGEPVRLTPLEYEILAFLARNAGRVITHEHLLRAALGDGYEDATGTLRVHILNLRRKLEAVPARPSVIVTEPGVGYRLKID